MRYKICIACVVFFFAILFLSTPAHAEERLMIFVGAASKPATEEAVSIFEKQTGIHVDAVFGGSGYVLSQMVLAKEGDIYFPGSSDYMEKAKREGYVYPETEEVVVYLVPAINVQKGNPKHIKNLKDLTRKGIKVIIANPEGVCVGAYAVEIIEKNLTAREKKRFKKNILNYTESCSKTMTAVSLKSADAVIGWRVFHYWDPETVETIPLKSDEIVRVGYIPIAISTFTRKKALAQRFIDFMLSAEAKSIFQKYHYFSSPEEAFAWIGLKPVGGEYTVPAEWIRQ
ncbi:MAG: molybdate ABC transporter substrate-binding protein [Candidatus Brocadiaceae bacterium]|nr:molybdate ABC transporter substrate-binding protein [Candidatus Brocadiaceae bacterium]